MSCHWILDTSTINTHMFYMKIKWTPPPTTHINGTASTVLNYANEQDLRLMNINTSTAKAEIMTCKCVLWSEPTLFFYSTVSHQQNFKTIKNRKIDHCLLVSVTMQRDSAKSNAYISSPLLHRTSKHHTTVSHIVKHWCLVGYISTILLHQPAKHARPHVSSPGSVKFDAIISAQGSWCQSHYNYPCPALGWTRTNNRRNYSATNHKTMALVHR